MTGDRLVFKEHNVTNDLSCANITDQFSVSNSDAQLTYKVGLLSSPEVNILNNANIRKTGQDYWLSSPYGFGDYGAINNRVLANGNLATGVVYVLSGLRPAVSLKPNIEFISGDGSTANPYVVDVGVNP